MNPLSFRAASASVSVPAPRGPASRALARSPRRAPQAPIAAPLQRLHPGLVNFLRQQLHGQRPRWADPRLERFATDVFADDLMVECYFRPLHRLDPVGRARGWVDLIDVPFEQAVRAARRAERMALVTATHERPLAALAALVAPCGLFHAVHPFVQAQSGAGVQDRARIQEMARELLAPALQRLRGQHRGLADTLGGVLGGGDDGDCDPEQVARLATAVTLATLRLTERWSAAGLTPGQEGWSHADA